MRDTFLEKLRKKYLFGMLITSAFLFLAGCGTEAEEHGLTEYQAAGEENAADEEHGTAEVNKAGICVYVCGAVSNPGVYELDDGARVYEAVEAAGGMTGNASADSVNLARAAADGEQIYIPTCEEVQTQGIMPGTESAAADAQKKVNINTASAEELMTLTGIGEAKAESIIRYREENGGFQAIEDLMNISGIKEGVFEKIKDDITI